MGELILELWAFMKERKKFWMLPLVVVLLALGGLLVVTQGIGCGAVHLHSVLDPDPRPSNPDPFLTEVDLELVAWRHFDADGRQLCDSPLESKVCRSALDGPDTDLQPVAAPAR